uniref:Uncharacterized protein n=1 Tax=Rhizophora mucronata TaxID=61149 RepID=A0A2P2JSW1_RHIMU
MQSTSSKVSFSLSH